MTSSWSNWRNSFARILALAWPMLIGQVAVVANGVLDTAMTARYSATDLAALSVGSAVYVTVFIGGMGVVMALGPVVGQMYGAGRQGEIGAEFKQGAWLVLFMSLLGCAVLVWPEPWLAFAGASPQAIPKMSAYLHGLAVAFPAALGFQLFRALSNSVSRPKMVMAIQLAAVLMKAPLNWLFIYGADLGFAKVPALGGPGCSVATAIEMWVMLMAALLVLYKDKFYAKFEIWRAGDSLPRWTAQRELLRLGLPMGASYLIEVTGFVFMSLFIARFGSVAVAGHQVVVSIVSVLFMLPLSLAIATSTLVAQSIGARDVRHASALGWHGVVLTTVLSLTTSSAVFLARDVIIAAYTGSHAAGSSEAGSGNSLDIAHAALPLLVWVVAFHALDAIQTMAAFVVRAYKVATAPMVIYALAMWGVGLGGGNILGFDLLGFAPPALQGAAGFWFASTLGLAFAAALLLVLQAYVTHARRQDYAGLAQASASSQ
jgi:MATE family multidrug resistance protein